jgi:hypothetical protein
MMTFYMQNVYVLVLIIPFCWAFMCFCLYQTIGASVQLVNSSFNDLSGLLDKPTDRWTDRKVAVSTHFGYFLKDLRPVEQGASRVDGTF